MKEEFVEIQDNTRENQLIKLFKLKKTNYKRIGVDARLKVSGEKVDFELKSTTTGSVSTARGLHLEHLNKWENIHWIVGKYNKKAELECCYYGTPNDMKEWVKFWKNDIQRGLNISNMLIEKIDFDMLYKVFGKKKKYSYKEAKQVFKKLFKIQEYHDLKDLKDGYSPERMLEMFKEHNKLYLYRGAALNNPKIPYRYYKNWKIIDGKYDKEIRKLVKSYLRSK